MLPSAFGSSASGDRGGIIGGMPPAGGRASWANSSQNGAPFTTHRSVDDRGRLPYIKDLQDQAARLEVDEISPVLSTPFSNGVLVL